MTDQLAAINKAVLADIVRSGEDGNGGDEIVGGIAAVCATVIRQIKAGLHQGTPEEFMAASGFDKIHMIMDIKRVLREMK